MFAFLRTLMRFATLSLDDFRLSDVDLERLPPAFFLIEGDLERLDAAP